MCNQPERGPERPTPGIHGRRTRRRRSKQRPACLGCAVLEETESREITGRVARELRRWCAPPAPYLQQHTQHNTTQHDTTRHDTIQLTRSSTRPLTDTTVATESRGRREVNQRSTSVMGVRYLWLVARLDPLLAYYVDSWKRHLHLYMLCWLAAG